jgi:hypothetical protein
MFFTFAVAAGAQVNASARGKTAPVGTSGAEHAASLCREWPLRRSTAFAHPDRIAHRRQRAAEASGPSMAFAAPRCCNSRIRCWICCVLNQHFPHDSGALYVTVHAYSDLSSRPGAHTDCAGIHPWARDGCRGERTAMQVGAGGKHYSKLLDENPRYPGIHFPLARLLLSKANSGPDFQDEAKSCNRS